MAQQLMVEIKDKLSSVKPDIITFNILLKGESLRLSDQLANGTENVMEALEETKTILERIEEFELKPSEITYNTILDICVKGGVMPLAIHFFEKM